MIGLESLTAAGVDKELKYYVYMLCNPLKDDEPFYVGKGSGHRAHHHVKEAKSDVSKLKRPNLHKINTIKQILSHGSNVIIKYIDIGLSENVAFELEEFLIPFIGRKDLEKGPLTNHTDGGEGTRGGTSSRGEKNPNYGKRGEDSIWWGKHHSEETKKLQSAKQKGKKLTEEHKQKLRKPKSEEGRRNIAQARIDSEYVPTADHKQKISSSLKGRPSHNKGKKTSDETKKKQSIANRGIPKPKSPCKYCGLECAHNLINRFHNENCKHKP